MLVAGNHGLDHRLGHLGSQTKLRPQELAGLGVQGGWLEAARGNPNRGDLVIGLDGLLELGTWLGLGYDWTFAVKVSSIAPASSDSRITVYCTSAKFSVYPTTKSNTWGSGNNIYTHSLMLQNGKIRTCDTKATVVV